MRYIGIDFARSNVPVLGASLRPTLWWGLTAVAVAASISAAALIWKANSDAQRLNERIDQLDVSARAQEDQQQQGSGLSTEALEVINGAVRQLNYPWPEVLGALERHVRAEVFLVSLEVGIVRTSTKIVIQAPDIDEALSYVDSLKDEPAMRGISVVKQESTSVEGGASGVRVTLDLPQHAAVAPVVPRNTR